MSKYTRPAVAGLAVVSAAALCALPVLSASARSAGTGPASARTNKHVLLISVDGMHQSDLDWYIANHPSSTLAKLTHGGIEYTNAETSKVQEGVVYSKPTKLAEHGGMNTGDRHVLMIVNGPGVPTRVVSASVETTQVAPTILALLGLNPAALRAVKVEGTQVLPWLGRGIGVDGTGSAPPEPVS